MLDAPLQGGAKPKEVRTMAIAVQLDFEGATLDQYDQVCKLMGLTPKGPGPAGAISHFATMTDSGLRVVDVWQTREAFDAFAQEQIGPFSAEVGLPPPEMQFFDVHNYFTPGD
ncbi:MAG: hypothetical protein ACOYXM_05445 [Actinomycetota bacterium]